VANNLTAAIERQNRHYEGLQSLRKRGVVMHKGEERPEVTGTQLTLQVCCCWFDLSLATRGRDNLHASKTPKTESGVTVARERLLWCVC
jgi:hypothetical protein